MHGVSGIAVEQAGMTPAGNAGQSKRFAYIDLLKAFASQLIVLHHLAFYGPMADFVHPAAPSLIDWLGSDGRMAVQTFLVIGGFLAAKSLCPSGKNPGIGLLSTVLRRWLKLVPPYTLALMLAVGASSIAAMLMSHHSISVLHGWRQILAHLFLLQDVLGHESLSAGMWYIAIDFQLYAGFALLLWCCRMFYRDAPPWLVPAMVSFVGALSLAVFNRDRSLEIWAIYFFGSYSLGILAWWASDPQRSRSTAIVHGATLVIIAVYALEIEFRARIAVSLITALLLLAGRRGALVVPNLRVIGFLARISYSLLLVHFPVSLLVNAVFFRMLPHTPTVQAAGMLVAWLGSVTFAAVFHRWVESPLLEVSSKVAAARSRFSRLFDLQGTSGSASFLMKVFRG
jgi:peptidoglycan/LPS O-acetylase OafA/YrhL